MHDQMNILFSFSFLFFFYFRDLRSQAYKLNMSSSLSLILRLSLPWLINQAKPSLLAFPRAQAQTIFLGLSQAQAKFELLTFPNESSLNMHDSTKLSSFIAYQMLMLLSINSKHILLNKIKNKNLSTR